MTSPTSNDALICKAIIQEGPRKGQSCLFPPGSNGYCGRHQRNKLFDDGITEGKLWCRFFFRGCDNTVVKSATACETCKGKKAVAKIPCGHDGCRNNAKEGKYCGKHTRDSFKEKEAELGIKHCDIARGCFNICPEGFTSCDACREKDRVKDNTKYATRKAAHLKTTIAYDASTPANQPCCYCGKEFISFLTVHNKPSRACPACNLTQKKQDEKRKERVRNYKETHAKYPDTHFKQYFTNAIRRGHSFELTIEEFSDLVSKPCYYCGYFKEGEVNGIDRFDNDDGYTLFNCRSSCTECNYIKYIFHPLFLIEKAKLLAGHTTESEKFFERWACYYSRIAPATYAAYKASAKKKELLFELKREEFNWITTKPCYICGFKGPNGIDRKDSSKGYNLENSYTCCYSCNMSKSDIEYSKFIERNYMIASLWKDTSSITLPLPTAPPKKVVKSDKRRHWKAAGLYTDLVNNTYELFLDNYADVAKRGEIDSLRLTILSQPFDDAIVTLRRFLNTCNIRRKRLREKDVDTAEALTAGDDTIQLVD